MLKRVAAPTVIARSSTGRKRALQQASLILGLLILAFAGSWFRLPAQSRSLLWAEDGMFLSDALARPADLGLLLTPYAGYLHLLPRIVAGLVAALAPVSAYPILMTALVLSLTSVIAVLIYLLARHHGLSAPAALCLYGLTFLAPALPTEVFGNVANLHWFVLWLAPWLFLARPRRRRSGIALAVITLFAVLTEIQVVLFLPLLAWRPRRDHRWMMGVVGLAGAVGQVYATQLSPRARPPFELSIHSASVISEGFVAHAGGAIWLTRVPPVEFVGSIGWPMLAILTLLPSAVAALFVIFGTRFNRMLALMLVFGALVTWTAAAVVNDFVHGPVLEPLSRLDPSTPIQLLRHAIVPAWMLAALLPVAADALQRRLRGTAKLLAVACVAPLLLSWGLAYLDQSQVLRTSVTPWTAEVALAREACANPNLTQVKIPIPPGADWGLTISCQQLLR